MERRDSSEMAPVARTTVRLAKLSEISLREAELSPSQYRLLTYLAEGSAAAAALAERLIVSRPSVTTLVDGLVERGLVERRADPLDRRRVDHVLTPAGRHALSRGDAAIGDMLHRLTERLDPTKARLALEGLGAIHEALESALAERELGRGSDDARPARPVANS